MSLGFSFTYPCCEREGELWGTENASSMVSTNYSKLLTLSGLIGPFPELGMNWATLSLNEIGGRFHGNFLLSWIA
jgi:hypothetical protein